MEVAFFEELGEGGPVGEGVEGGGLVVGVSPEAGGLVAGAWNIVLASNLLEEVMELTHFHKGVENQLLLFRFGGVAVAVEL